MNQLTIGQRIASRRKILNLSQEALSEQLSVSRQAVSKWESDAAIPEIDKIIALGKIFDVSVGWLLGVESESDAGFTEEQLQIVEKLIVKYQPTKKQLVWRLTAFISALAIFIAIFAYLGHCIQLLGEKNQVLYEQVSGLNTENSALKLQVNNLNDLIIQQIEGESLLSNVSIHYIVDDKLENVSITCYMTPKIYQEYDRTFLWVQNPLTGYDELIKCTWSQYHNKYIANFECPIADCYKLSFVVGNVYGEPTFLNMDNLAFQACEINYISTYCRFHLAPENPEFERLNSGKSARLGVDTAVYTYNDGVYAPHIYPKTTVGYKNITISLKYNGETIWEGDYLEAFNETIDVTSVNSEVNPVYPAISVELPKLEFGDTLKLILTAESINGGASTQQYETLLDYRVVTE